MMEIIERAKLLFLGERQFRCALRRIMGFWPGRHLHVYKTALLHKSMRGSENNERLEYLGDAVIDAVVSDYVFHRYPTANEGQLTQVRSRLVSRESLGQLAHQLGIDAMLRSNLKYENSHNNYLAGNAFEAFVGAIYLDKGYKACTRFLMRGVLHNIPMAETIIQKEVNHKSLLLEWAQKRRLPLHFEMSEQPDPDPKKSSPIFTATAIVAGIKLGSGRGYSKKQATQEAARLSLGLMQRPGIRDRLKKARQELTAKKNTI